MVSPFPFSFSFPCGHRTVTLPIDLSDWPMGFRLTRERQFWPGLNKSRWGQLIGSGVFGDRGTGSA